MPVVGDPLSVRVTGQVVHLANRTGSRHRFRVGDEVVMVDGNTSAVVIAERLPVTVMCEGRTLWPIESAP